MRKKKQENMASAPCRYCGQIIQLFLPEGRTADSYDQEELVEMATGRCACDEAVTASNRVAQIKGAKGALQELFDRLIEESPEEAVKLTAQQTLISDAVNLICSAAIESAQIRMDAHTHFAMGLKSNGELRIRRTFRGTEEWLF